MRRTRAELQRGDYRDAVSSDNEPTKDVRKREGRGVSTSRFGGKAGGEMCEARRSSKCTYALLQGALELFLYRV